MKEIIIISTISGLLFASCTEHHAGHNHKHSNHSESHSHENSKDAVGVKLNNGNRWKANSETTNSIKIMKAKVKAFDYSGGDIGKLKSELDGEFGKILKSCTMTGEAHDQLHAYLMPLRDRINGLDSEGENEVSELATYLNEYGNYFE